MTPIEAGRMPPLTLAYLGDAVFELYVRSRLLHESHKPTGALHRQAVLRVKATAQADAVRSIMEKLTQEEKDVVRRGRNARSSSHRAIHPADYHYSTAFEALLGYLYLIGQHERLDELMGLAFTNATED